ncbi:uncharacterized protein LOC118182833 [Stegodyphus dumicola]|uniref:uncharacterized protein LOC118182833 n=1 Tax=Stegodyphus dumicola TaxID=202533 RepID=UPI0015AEF275|nr:uncharacterized protein LOC118182833 [Stegodyphus dumicola]
MASVKDMEFWVVDGSSIEYLDLRTCEFQREKIPRVVSSFDLSLRSTPPTAPYVPLIPVFVTKSGRKSVSFPDWTTTVFFDFSRSILQKLELICEEDIAKLYVSHLRAFCHYVARSFYPAMCFSISLSPQRKCRSLRTSRIKLINSLKLEATWKLVEILFGKVRLDSGVIMDILDPICSWKKLAQISLKSDPAITDSILSHLRRNQRWVTTEELIKFFSSNYVNVARPKHILVFLNHGFKNMYNPVSGDTLLLWRISSDRNIKPRFRRIYHEILACFIRRMSMDKREALILEMCAMFFCSGERDLSNYIESMCYIWRSIPDVYITLEEIKHTLFKFLDIENDEFVEEICQELQRRGFNGFEVKQETNSAQTSEEPESEIGDFLFADSHLSEEYDSPDDRLSVHDYFGDAKRCSSDSKFQLLDEQFCTNSLLSKNPDSLISLPRGVFLPYRFTDTYYFLRGVSFNLILFTSVVNSLIDPDKPTFQPRCQFGRNLSKAEEVLALTSQRSEEPDDPLHEPRNPLQCSRKAATHSITQNSQSTRDIENRNSLSSQAPKNYEMSNFELGNLSESPAHREQGTGKLLFRIKDQIHDLRGLIRKLLIHKSRLTEDSLPQARHLPKGKIRNSSISSSKLPKKHDNFIILPSLLLDSRSASRRNSRGSHFQLPDKGSRITPPTKVHFHSKVAVRYGATYNSYLPEETLDHPNTNYPFSQVAENSEIPFSRAKNVAESRIRTVMARIWTLPGLWSTERLLAPKDKLTTMVRDSLIRILQWTEDSANPYIQNLQLPEDPNIQRSSLFLCNPDDMGEVPNHILTFPDELDAMYPTDNQLFLSFTRELNRNNPQWTEDPLFDEAVRTMENMARLAYHQWLDEWHATSTDTQVRNFELPKTTDHAGHQPRRLLHYTRCVIRDALILNSQLPQGITLLNLPERLQSYLKLEL